MSRNATRATASGFGQGLERQRAGIASRASAKVIATRDHGFAQCVSDGRQVGDLGFHLGQFCLHPCLQPGVRLAVMMGGGVEQVCHLGQGEAEALGGLDHPQSGHHIGASGGWPPSVRSGWVQQTTPLVIPQRLEIHSGGVATCPARSPSRSSQPAPGGRGAARPARPGSPPVLVGHLDTSRTSRPPEANSEKREERTASAIPRTASSARPATPARIRGAVEHCTAGIRSIHPERAGGEQFVPLAPPATAGPRSATCTLRVRRTRSLNDPCCS